MVLITDDKMAQQVDVMEEANAPPREKLSEFRRMTVDLPLNNQAGAESIRINHGSNMGALIIELNRTIRVPDNKDTNMLPPGLGPFPLFKVQDYASRMPEDMAKKGGLFFPMYQREAMWINFRATAPFAIKIYVGGVNAVSGLPINDNEKTKEKRLKMLKEGRKIQDYMVVPGQQWLDGVVSEDGKIRQFIAKPKGSGFSVEAQVTGEEKVGGIQIEIIPIKRDVPKEIEVRYENAQAQVIKRTLKLSEKNLSENSTWLDLKKALREEFDIAVKDQVLSAYPYNFDNHLNPNDDAKLACSYFQPNFVLSLKHAAPRPTERKLGMMMAKNASMVAAPGSIEDEEECEVASYGCGYGGDMLAFGFGGASPSPPPPPGMAPLPAPSLAAPLKKLAKSASASSPRRRAEVTVLAKPKVKEMGLSAGGFIQQTIEPDTQPADIWDVEASLMFNIQILDSESFSEVTGLPPPPTPIDAETYASYDYPFFEIWGEEKTGVKGDFSEVKSVAQIEAEHAKARGEEYKEEESVPQRVYIIGKFKSTFRPVQVLTKELEALDSAS